MEAVSNAVNKNNGEVKKLKMKFLLLQIGKFRMDYVLRKARLMAKTKMSGGSKTPGRPR